VTHAYAYFLTLLSARTLVIFVVMVVGFRLLGKRELGQLNVYDLAMIMAAANAVQNAMTSGTGTLCVGIACAGTLLLAGKAITKLFIRLPRIERSIVGTPTLLIRNGEIIKSHLRREGLTTQQLLQALRQHGCVCPEDISLAVLEVDGSITVVARDGGDACSVEPNDESKTPTEAA
jgi:uncharacterized membrane protein YcaP (DUF421 family)